MLWNSLSALFAWPFALLHSVTKVLLRLWTGKSHVERILASEKPTSAKAVALYKAISQSKVLKAVAVDIASHRFDVDATLTAIFHAKKIRDHHDTSSPIRKAAFECLTQLQAYNQIVFQVTNQKNERYDSKNPLHEELLMKLWSALKPEEELQGRITQQWGDIGFQGKDPATDFRGMGILGLQQLLFLAETQPANAQNMLQVAESPNYYYPFAVTGIQITASLVKKLLDGDLRIYLCKPGISVNLFHRLYCDAFVIFHAKWVSQPRQIMEFPSVYAEFVKELPGKLHTSDLQ